MGDLVLTWNIRSVSPRSMRVLLHLLERTSPVIVGLQECWRTNTLDECLLNGEYRVSEAVGSFQVNGKMVVLLRKDHEPVSS